MHTRSRQARLASLLDGALDSVEEMIRKRRSVALLGLAGHGLYHFLWTAVYPQPYESVELRSALAAMFVVFLLPTRWLLRMGSAWSVCWHLTFMLNLPFFFTYMALRNDSWQWVMGLEAALLLMHLLTSGTLTIVLTALGVTLGALCAEPFGIEWQNCLVMQAWPVLLFGLVAAAVLSRSRLQHSRRKTAALMSYAGYIAHEMRTPLASIAARASMTREGTTAASEDREQHLAELSREVQRTFALIDILLTNVDPMRHTSGRGTEDTQARQDWALISDVIAEALLRYPFRDAAERERVQVRVLEDCPVRGSPLLLQHVVMNLVRNAFEHCSAGGVVVLGITARRRAQDCELSIEDNGRGFAAAGWEQAGLGLMFCHSVARSIGGNLRVLASPSGGCSVKLNLPSASAY
ncbi:HAMP domain-containing histidine kinase [Pelomonas sp. P7]|uniref:histidine kinase n=1 Tax=Pelomonas caseinilytica TaxID=2906763 RepID=A0ABS8XCM5_9BURK|nr:HAMP domain-containing sensor histidine kinase [Pelomonas sp. P7]MCE4536323.1 HAMP domain-containing histidine kinase [Pelomonas sp. P7]